MPTKLPIWDQRMFDLKDHCKANKIKGISTDKAFFETVEVFNTQTVKQVREGKQSFKHNTLKKAGDVFGISMNWFYGFSNELHRTDKNIGPIELLQYATKLVSDKYQPLTKPLTIKETLSMKQKLLLPNGCYCSEPRISPKSAYGKNASTSKDWCVQYRFYDPRCTNDAGKIIPHQVVFKGMNEYKNVTDRRIVAKALIDDELTKLKQGFNPRSAEFIAPSETGEIEPTTHFIRALELAREKLKCSDTTKKDIKSCLGFIGKSATKLNLHNLPIDKIRRKHVSQVLDNCRTVKNYWSSHLFNHYRAYLMMCFKKLIELEAIESNPVDEHLPKESVQTPVRKTLNNDQVKQILEHFSNDIPYLRFIHIFFHSGARPVELLRLKTTDVDLQQETFTIINKKGNKLRMQEKKIKKVALQYWAQLMEEAKPGEYLFGNKQLAPGVKPATRDYVTKKWNRLVKDDNTGLGIKIDLYSLKHKNLDEIAAYLSISDAQKAAGHESPVITMVYATGEANRQRDKYASVPNALGG